MALFTLNCGTIQDGFEIESEEVDVTGFLRGGGLVFEEGTDSDVEMELAAGMVCTVEEGKIGGNGFIGIGKENDTVALEGLKEIFVEVGGVRVGHPERLGVEFGENYSRAFRLNNADCISAVALVD